MPDARDDHAADVRRHELRLVDERRPARLLAREDEDRASSLLDALEGLLTTRRFLPDSQALLLPLLVDR